MPDEEFWNIFVVYIVLPHEVKQVSPFTILKVVVHEGVTHNGCPVMETDDILMSLLREYVDHCFNRLVLD